MSFKNYKDKIDQGDTVILYLSNTLYAIDVQPEIKNKKGDLVENVFQTTFGALKVKNLIGTEYGSRVQLSKGWGHILQPTPELWSLTLPHRTQIIYTPDISMILLQLDLVPGSVVIEAGTGSGSLTHALIRRVKPHGHVHTFDFHEYRAKVASEEFEGHGIAEYVTAKHRDVLQDGFGDNLNGKADAVFLDLPSPWLGVPHAVAAMKEQGGRFCSFSPCIEQVQRTCLALQEHGFEDLATMEVLQTELKVSRRTVPVRDLSFLKHKSSEKPVEEKPSGDTTYVVGSWPASQAGHTGYLTVATLPPAFSTARPATPATSPWPRCRRRSPQVGEQCEKPVEEKPSGDTTYVVGSWPASQAGHTGYLTVATLPPAFTIGKNKVPKTDSSVEEKNGAKMAVDEADDMK